MKPHFHLIPKDLEDTYLCRHHTLPNLGTVWHFHPEIELHYIIRGEGVRFVGNNISNFDTGELLLLGAGLPHMWRCNEKYFKNDPMVTAEAVVVQFLPEFMGKDFLQKKEATNISSLFERSKVGLIIEGDTKKEIVNLMQNCVNSKGLPTLIYILSMLEILSRSSELTPISTEQFLYQSDQEENDRLNKVIAFTLKNYSSEINLEEISEVANLTVTSFCRYFKKITKKPFHDFLIEIRISYAKRILLEDNKQTTEAVCFEVGFNNRSNFFRHFKNKTGYTPVEYKREFNFKNPYFSDH